MAIKKTSKSHASTRKKASASATLSPRTRKAASNVSKSAGKAKLTKKQKMELNRRKREDLTLKMFQMVYDDYQQGKMRLLFR